MINQLIKENKIEIFFQPIISIKNKKIFAFEALTRAYDENGDFISPMYLFDQAKKENIVNTLDCYVRELALKKFVQYHKKNKDVLLFLNFESNFIDSTEYSSFLRIVQKYNICSSNIVLEIKEDEIKDNKSIKKFVNFYRKNKFIIAIDDFGTGYSSFDRLSLIKPDIVKMDRSLIYNIDTNFINSEILTAVANMCHKIGAIVLAEGVEQKNEVLNCMQKDIDIFQGFYFAKPKKEVDTNINRSLQVSIEDIGKSYKQNIKDIINHKKQILKDTQNLSEKIVDILNHKNNNITNDIKNLISKHKKLEAIYTIDFNTGLQKNDTIITVKENTLFNATKSGHDHTLKEYYFIAKNSSKCDYLSGTYVSKASGNICVTYSSTITIQNTKYILCLDIKTS